MELTLGEKIIRVENNYRNVESSALRQLLIAKNNDAIVKYGRQVSREYDLKSPVLAQCIYVGDKITAAIERKNVLFYRKQHGLPVDDVLIDSVDELPSKRELITNFNEFQANQFDFTSNIHSNQPDKKEQTLGIAYKNLSKWSLKSVEVEKELKQLLSISNDEIPSLNNFLRLKGLPTGLVDTLIKCNSNESAVIGKEEMCYITSHFKHSTNVFEIVQGTYVSNNIDTLVTTLSKQGNSAETETCALLKASTIDNKIHIRPLCSVSDILLAAEELFESNSPFVDGCIAMPKVLPKVFKRAVGSYFRYQYTLNKPGQWYHIQINLPKGLVYGTTIRQLACPLVFSTEYMEINPVNTRDVDAKLVESCEGIVKRIRNMYNEDLLLSEMRLDFEPCYISTKVNKNESKNKYFYRLMHISHFKCLERNTSSRRNAVEGVHSLIKERLHLFAKIFKKEKNRILDLKYKLRSASVSEVQGTDIESIHLHSLAKTMAVEVVDNYRRDDMNDDDSDEAADINDTFDDGLNEYPLETHAVVRQDTPNESVTNEYHVDPVLIEMAKKKYYRNLKNDNDVTANAAVSRVTTPRAITPNKKPVSRQQQQHSHTAKAAPQYGLLTAVDADNTTVITVDKFLKLWDDICEQEYAYSRELDAIMHSTKYAGSEELNDIIYDIAASNPLDTLFEDAPSIAQDIRAKLNAKYDHNADDTVENEGDKYRLEFNQSCDQALHSILQGLNVHDVGHIMNRLNKPKKKVKKSVQVKPVEEPVKVTVEKKSRIVKRVKKEVLTTRDVAVIIDKIKKPPKIVRKYVEVPVYVRKERAAPVVDEEERNMLLRKRMEVEAELMALKAARAERLRQLMLKALMTRYLQCMNLPKVTLDGNLLEEEKLLEELRQIELDRSKKFHYLNKESKIETSQVGGSLWNNESKPMLIENDHKLSSIEADSVERVAAATFVSEVVCNSMKTIHVKDAAKIESTALVTSIMEKITEYIGAIATAGDNEYVIISDPIDLMVLKISQESNALVSEAIYSAQEEVARVSAHSDTRLMNSIELTDSIVSSHATLIEEEECFQPFDDEDSEPDLSLDSRTSINLTNFNVNITPRSSMSVALPEESIYSECIYVPNLNLAGITYGESVTRSSILESREESADEAAEIVSNIARHFVVNVIYECVSRNLDAAANTAQLQVRVDDEGNVNNSVIKISVVDTSMSASNLSIIAAAIPTPLAERRKPHKPVESRQIVMAAVYNDEKKRRSTPKAGASVSKASTGQYLSFLDPVYAENGVQSGIWMPFLATTTSETVVDYAPVNNILDDFKPPLKVPDVPHRPVASGRKENKVNDVAWKRKSTKAMKVLTENIKKVSGVKTTKNGTTVEDPFAYTGDDRYGAVNSIPNEKLIPTTTRIVPPALPNGTKSTAKDNLFTFSMLDYYMSEQRRLLDDSLCRTADTPEITSEQRRFLDYPELMSTPGYEKIWTTKPVYGVVRPAAKGKESLLRNEEKNLGVEIPKTDNVPVLAPPDAASSIEGTFTDSILTADPYTTSTVAPSIVQGGGSVIGLHGLLTVDKMKIGVNDARIANAPVITAGKEVEASEALISQDSTDVLHPRPPTVSHSSKPKSLRAESVQVVEPEAQRTIESLVVGNVRQASPTRPHSPVLPRIGNKSPSKSVKLASSRVYAGKPQIGKHMQAEGYRVLREMPQPEYVNEYADEADEMLLNYQVSVQELFESYLSQKYGQNKFDTGNRRYDRVGERTYVSANSNTTITILENLSREREAN